MIRSIFARAAFALGLASLVTAPVAAQTASSITVKDGTGASVTLGAGDAGGKRFYGMLGAAADGSAFVLPSDARVKTLTDTVGAAGSPQATAQTVTVVLPQLTAVAGLATSFGTTAATLFNANANRRFLRIQVQGAPDTAGTNGCWINGLGTATPDANSLFIPRGALFESSTEVGTGAISIVCSATMAVFSRQG